MSDLIDRQAAIAAITDELMPSTPLSAVIRAKNRLKELPSAQPDHNADISKKVDDDDCISRQAAIDAIMGQPPEPHYPSWYAAQIEKLPAVQPEQTELIKEIRKWINSGNRGSADYFIVDKIEEIINKYE